MEETKVLILVPDGSWSAPYAEQLLQRLRLDGHTADIHFDPPANPEYDLCFLLSWANIVTSEYRSHFAHTLVIHASDLPKGRGWSPWVWHVLEGREELVVSLIEAEDKVDSGDIYFQERARLSGTELLDELRDVIGEATVKLCRDFVNAYHRREVIGSAQQGEGTYYARRTANDSEIDPHKSIAEQFNLLRVVDNDRYPAFFTHRGRRYTLRITAED